MLGCPAPKEKPKLFCAQPERNIKISLSHLFVPPPFSTLHKFSSIIDRYMLPIFIDCISLLIPNYCFHFFFLPPEFGFQAVLSSFLALESQLWFQSIFGCLMSSSWKSSTFSITFAPSGFFFLTIILFIWETSPSETLKMYKSVFSFCPL